MERCKRLLDYVRFTVSDYNTISELSEQLPWDLSERGYGGVKWYKNSGVALGNAVTVYWDGVGDAQGTACIQLSGTACRDLESREGFTWQAFFAEWLGRGASFSRTDVAFDDLGSSVSMDTVLEHLESRSYRARCRKDGLMWERRDGLRTRTAYFGARESEAFLRVYEKGALTKTGDWLRFEFEFKGAKAQQIAEAYAEGREDTVPSLCRSVIDFVSLEGGSVVSRRKVCGWWLDLLSRSVTAFEPVKVWVDSVARRWAWMLRQVAQTAWAFNELQGGCMEWFRELVEHGGDRANDRALRLVEVGRTTCLGSDFAIAGSF